MAPRWRAAGVPSSDEASTEAHSLWRKERSPPASEVRSKQTFQGTVRPRPGSRPEDAVLEGPGRRGPWPSLVQEVFEMQVRVSGVLLRVRLIPTLGAET